MNMPKGKRRVVIGFLMIGILTLGAYSTEKIGMERGIGTAKIIKVTDKKKVLAYISSDILRQLMNENMEQADDNLPIGPSLLLTISAAGVNHFNQLELRGRAENQSMVINQEDLSDDLVLFLTSEGMVNLCEKKDPSRFLVKEITEIHIIN